MNAAQAAVGLGNTRPTKQFWAALAEDNPANDPDWIRARFAEGLNVAQVAALAGCNHETIRKRMKWFGIAKPPDIHKQGFWHDPAWVEAQRRAGVSVAEMARQAGCTKVTMTSAIKKHGLQGIGPALVERKHDVAPPPGVQDDLYFFRDCLTCPDEVTSCEGCPNDR